MAVAPRLAGPVEREYGQEERIAMVSALEGDELVFSRVPQPPILIGDP